ncbi:MAG: right-handed parallel beta-helix repeat-containing protein [Candidatus Hydrogenedentes bacterium]|nr:right-handed parallel beta-helix repeat-containing protein [Candidatus Hydrogenedentota bacterium]
MSAPPVTRRGWLAGLAATAGWGRLALGRQDPPTPPELAPKAISGDSRNPTEWTEPLVITVGGPDADIQGFTDRAIQAAVDYIAARGSGAARLTTGTFTLRNAVYLRPGVRLTGAGEATILRKAPMERTALARDADWYDQELALVDASGFPPGCGICLEGVQPHSGTRIVVKRTVIARDGNRVLLDRALRENFWVEFNPVISSLFPLVTAENASRLAIENLVLDGNRAENAALDGNYAGCLWFQDCSDITIRNVIARDYNGDGISWQICHDVTLEHCKSLDNTMLGMHPGSGSQRPVIRDCELSGNGIGVFFCWGVRHGLVERCDIHDNTDSGISIGHRDHGNLIRECVIRNNGNHGILFRPERGEGFTATANTIENCRIVDNGGENSAAVEIQGVTSGNRFIRNHFEETRDRARRVAIRLAPESGEQSFEKNRFQGFYRDIERVKADT